MSDVPSPAAAALRLPAQRGMREALRVPMRGALPGLQPVTTDLFLAASPASHGR